jgi:hypothetical protein
MHRYIVLLLITGIVWAQTDFDRLVLKNGTTYLGEYEKIEGDRVYFRHQDALAFQPVPVELIKQLQLKDGRFIIGKDTRGILFCGFFVGVFFLAAVKNINRSIGANL